MDSFRRGCEGSMSQPDQPAGSLAGARGPWQNPVFQHLTRREGWPSVREAGMLLAILSGGGCLGIYVVALLMVDAFFRYSIPISLVVFPLPLVGIILALISPFASAMVTVIGTVRDANSDMLRVLRLTRLTPREIVFGYLWVALYRLRLLWVLCYGLLPPLWGAIMVMSVPLSPYGSPTDMLEYAGPALWIVFCGAVLGTGLNWLAVCAGVSAALRWRSIGAAVGAAAGAALAAFVALVVVLYCGFITALGTYDAGPGRAMMG